MLLQVALHESLEHIWSFQSIYHVTGISKNSSKYADFVIFSVVTKCVRQISNFVSENYNNTHKLTQ